MEEKNNKFNLWYLIPISILIVIAIIATVVYVHFYNKEEYTIERNSTVNQYNNKQNQTNSNTIESQSLYGLSILFSNILISSILFSSIKLAKFSPLILVIF